MTEFQRIAIVNRGEAAVRLIRAVDELNREEDGSLRTIAFYTEPDRRSVFVRSADEAVNLGSATFVDPRDGRRKNRYLDYEALERALCESRAEAVWVGWGFVAEHAEFADLCKKLGIVFIGPDPEVMRALGDKIGSKRMAEQSGVPVAPWSGGAVESLEAAREQAQHLGFPLMVKATAGGGGRGIRRVRSMDELDGAFESARSEALAGFGDETVFMERLVEGARHVEVQIVGDGQGTTWALGVRDCTVQRRNQKVIEESPSPALSAEQQRELCEAAARLGNRSGYRNAGTVEFLYDPGDQVFSFMEVNARLQVEHPVTELTTGADLVKLQIQVARGGRLEGDPPSPRGHAIEVRVNAEDPERGFMPSPGRIELFRLPGGPGLRIDSGFVENDTIAPDFDSMLAKVIAHGRDRGEALARLEGALYAMQIAVRGGSSNKGFLLSLLQRPEVRSSEVDVGWLDRLATTGDHLSQQHANVALLQGAIEAYDAELAVEVSQFYAMAARGRLQLRREVGLEVELRSRGTRYAMRVFRTESQRYRVVVDGCRIGVEVERIGPLEQRLRIAGRNYHVLSVSDGLDQLVEVEGVPHRLSRDAAGIVRSPAPAVVVSIAVKEGDRVSQGDRLGVLEAMKTEIPVISPCSGVVRDVLVASNVQVDAGVPLVLVEAAEQQEEVASDRVTFDDLVPGATEEQDPELRCAANLDELRHLALGFDFDAAEARRIADGRRALCTELPPDHPNLLRGERELLSVFADACALFQQRSEVMDLEAEESRMPEEYLLLYLRSLDPAAAGVSTSFVDRLRRTLSHYGIEELERSRELVECMLWICKAHQRIDEQAGIVMSILERRLEHCELLVGQVSDEFRELLDRIIEVSWGHHQAVSDLAREVRYRYFDRPFFEENRERLYAEVDQQLEAGAGEEDSERRGAIVNALVDCTEPLVPELAPRFEGAESRLHALMLEVLTRRYYRIRRLDDLRTVERDGRIFILTSYEHEDGPIHVATVHSAWKTLDGLWAPLLSLLDELPGDEEVMIDLYLSGERPLGDPDETAGSLEERIAAQPFSGRRIRRIVAALAAPEGGRGMGAMQHFTFRPAEGAFREDRLYRGLHPMMGKRLQLWRLQNFEIERIPSSEDVYLFHGVAHSNPKDERLFAFVEVRDLTPVRDDEGRITRLPNLEMQYLEALAAIRLVQSHRSARQRLHWNRMILYLWPPVELSVDELNEIAHRLMPAADGLGLQKIIAVARMRDFESGELRDTVAEISSPGGDDVVLSLTRPGDQPISTRSDYEQRVVRMRQRGMMYPYELIRLITPPRDGTRAEFPPGDFVEYDLDEDDRLVEVRRPLGSNEANMVVGVIRNFTAKHPEGMSRVILLGDPSRELGSFAEPECRRIMAAVDLAEERGLPLEWYPISAGAKIAMDSGTENLDWTAAALRRIVEFTQAGGEINLVVTGINVGGQSYWNAEATMLMHNKGVLIMTPGSSMLLTGKKALDYSGGVSAEDHEGIGGYSKIMGVNGEGQYWAHSLGDACRILFRHYEHAYVAPGERFARRAPTSDPVDRDICSFPYEDSEQTHFATVGDIFSDEKNPGRRKPFSIREVMRSVVDQDHAHMERWFDMREAESVVVWEAHLGGIPACLVGIESRAVTRLGFVPADGPDAWTAGTLFPLSSKKLARAINAASGTQPVVVLANLSGFDGSPESLRRLQLEYGAEIGRAVVNFSGPIIFCVISRYHGGAYVVFSRTLNENIKVAALEGSYASVIGGAPAAAVVFAGDVERRTRSDGRLQDLEAEIAEADESARGRLRTRWHELYDAVRSEKLGEVAEQFDQVHSVYRARKVGSLHDILPPSNLRPYLVEALERGIQQELDS